MAWGLIDSNMGVDWHIVIIEFYALFVFHFLFECIKAFIPKDVKIPVYIKSDVKTIVESIIMTVLQIGLMIVQLLIIPRTDHP